MTTSYALPERRNRRETKKVQHREYSVELGLRTHRPSAITSSPFEQFNTFPSHHGEDSRRRDLRRSDIYSDGNFAEQGFDTDTLSQVSNQPQYGDVGRWWDLPKYSPNNDYEQKVKSVRISYSVDEIYGKANVNHGDRTEIRCGGDSKDKLVTSSTRFTNLDSGHPKGTANVTEKKTKIRERYPNFQYEYHDSNGGQKTKFPTDANTYFSRDGDNRNQEPNEYQRQSNGACNKVRYRTFEEAMRCYPNDDTDDSDVAAEVATPIPQRLSPVDGVAVNSRGDSPCENEMDFFSSAVASNGATKVLTPNMAETIVNPPPHKSNFIEEALASTKKAWAVSPEEDLPEETYAWNDDWDFTKTKNGNLTSDSRKGDTTPSESVTIEKVIAKRGSRRSPVQRGLDADRCMVKNNSDSALFNLTQTTPSQQSSKGSLSLEGKSDTGDHSPTPLPDTSRVEYPKPSSACEVPPIDLSQLSPRKSKTNKPVKNSVSKSVSVPKYRASTSPPKPRASVQLQTESQKIQRTSSPLTPKSTESRNKKQIAREIKLRVQKNPKEIASEIKRRVQQKTKEASGSNPSGQSSSDYIKVDHQQLTNRSYMALNSFRGYDRYNEMSPRIECGEISRWQCLPEELWLIILSFLQRPDLHSFMLTCSDFNRLSHDRSLWNDVSLCKKQLSDDEIIKLGYLHPYRLSIIQCTGIKINGDMVTNSGLRQLFSSCGKDLTHLSTTSCVMPPLSGEAMLHHAVLHCSNIKSLDISWCNLTNRDIELVAESFSKLRQLSLNGNQAITDIAMTKLIGQLGSQLEQLELQGCFKLTNHSLQELGQCVNLRMLNIGQCHKFSSSRIMSEVSRLPYLEVCNLKGMKQLKDNCVAEIVKRCPNITHLVIAQCTALTPKTLVEVSCALSSLSSLDVSSCKDCVNDASICAMLANCSKLTSLDLSSTHITNHCIAAVVSYCSKLCELKLNFCSVTDIAIKELLAHSSSLKKLFLYGVKGVQLDELSDVNANVNIEN